MLNLEEKTYFLITGASRGIGRTFALRVAEKLKDDSLVVLVARNMEGLERTKELIGATGKKLTILTYSRDLGKATETDFQEILKDSLSQQKEEANNFQRAFIIHNAGSVGDVTKSAKSISSTEAWREYYHTNFFHVVSLNSEFFKTFKDIPKLVVNMSSKCALEPFPSMSQYCSGKAARDMYFRALAEEEKESPDGTIVLNYAPGAIDTDMTVLVQNETINEKLSATFKHMRDTQQILTTEQTAERFLQLLEENNFKSGDHCDYWDEI